MTSEGAGALRRGGGVKALPKIPADFRPPEHPGDRVIALEAVIDAKGHKLPSPPVCHGKANCCHCPGCDPAHHHRERKAA